MREENTGSQEVELDFNTFNDICDLGLRLVRTGTDCCSKRAVDLGERLLALANDHLDHAIADKERDAE